MQYLAESNASTGVSSKILNKPLPEPAESRTDRATAKIR
jgi:hypothetical protein